MIREAVYLVRVESLPEAQQVIWFIYHDVRVALSLGRPFELTHFDRFGSVRFVINADLGNMGHLPAALQE
jgi:hypothetical protein